MEGNRRVKMTKKLIKDSLLELLEKEPLKKISITDICERADVNRSTFYTYYKNIGQLMMEIENDILNQLPLPSEQSGFYSNDEFLVALKEFFDFVRENDRLFRVMIVQRDDSKFNQKIVNTVMEKYGRVPDNGTDIAVRYSYIYRVNGVIGVSKEWISSGFPVSTQEFAEIILNFATKIAM